MLNSNIFFYILVIITSLVFIKKIEKFTINRSSKCFDCEREIIKYHGIKSLWKALPTKCFDCEHNSKNNKYNTGPTKCFDCDNKVK